MSTPSRLISDYFPSKPCKAQGRLMRKLGFECLETDDALTAVWRHGPFEVRLPSGWAPIDESHVVQRLINQAYSDGMAAARQQMRAALGIQ